MELDQKIRDFANPTKASQEFDMPPLPESMKTWVRSHYQDLSESDPIACYHDRHPDFVDIVLLFLHRAYFAQAMMENPTNPLAGPHGQSVSAAYSSACAVLEDTRIQYLKQPMLCARIWRIWTFAFTAAVSFLAEPIGYPLTLCTGSSRHDSYTRQTDEA